MIFPKHLIKKESVYNIFNQLAKESKENTLNRFKKNLLKT